MNADNTDGERHPQMNADNTDGERHPQMNADNTDWENASADGADDTDWEMHPQMSAGEIHRLVCGEDAGRFVCLGNGRSVCREA
jgi:hypothetical protein